MYIADEVEFVRSTMACDFKEKVANDQYGRPRTDVVHMQVVAMGKASAGAGHCAGAYGAGGAAWWCWCWGWCWCAKPAGNAAEAGTVPPSKWTAKLYACLKRSGGPVTLT